MKLKNKYPLILALAAMSLAQSCASYPKTIDPEPNPKLENVAIWSGTTHNEIWRKIDDNGTPAIESLSTSHQSFSEFICVHKKDAAIILR